jgi:hypothetical protein
MTSYIKIGWARVFNAACEKEVAIDKWQDDQRTEWIDKHTSTLIGYLWWKRNPSKEEAEKAFIESDDAWIYDSIAEQRRTRAKKLQSMAITASTEYDTNMDQVYLTLDDNQFLFE